jgi:hypothetical protein
MLFMVSIFPHCCLTTEGVSEHPVREVLDKQGLAGRVARGVQNVPSVALGRYMGDAQYRGVMSDNSFPQA